MCAHHHRQQSSLFLIKGGKFCYHMSFPTTKPTKHMEKINQHTHGFSGSLRHIFLQNENYLHQQHGFSRSLRHLAQLVNVSEKRRIESPSRSCIIYTTHHAYADVSFIPLITHCQATIRRQGGSEKPTTTRTDPPPPPLSFLTPPTPPPAPLASQR